MSIQFKNTSMERLLIDTSERSRWMATTANNPIVYTHLYHGEVYDARRAPFNASLWAPATTYDWNANQQKGIGSVQVSTFPDISVGEEIKPVTVTQISTNDRDVYVFDLGKNIAGVTRLSGLKKLAEGTKLVLRHSEILNKDGTVQNTYCSWPCICKGQPDGGNCANQTDVFIAGDQRHATNTWEPLHTYHGFRYVQLEG